MRPACCGRPAGNWCSRWTSSATWTAAKPSPPNSARSISPTGPASSSQPFWLDFLSDTGDGGNATFTVAQALLARELTLTGPDGKPLHLPEGELLLLGGDLAYPGASPQEYQYRFIEMLAQAQDPASRFQATEAGPRKFIAAIPQNHDWFDSASTFCRYFVSHDKGAVIGARTPQRQTWFACRLPQGFWVLGLDFALAGDIDRQQFEGFVALLEATRPEGIQPGDQVLLIYPEPYWTRPLGDGAAPGYPHRYQRLEALIEARGAHIRLRLAGDLHHYVRETLAHDPLERSGHPSGDLWLRWCLLAPHPQPGCAGQQAPGPPARTPGRQCRSGPPGACRPRRQ